MTNNVNNYEMRKYAGTGFGELRTEQQQKQVVQQPQQTQTVQQDIFVSNNQYQKNNNVIDDAYIYDVEDDYIQLSQEIGMVDNSMVVGGVDYSNTLHTGIGETSADVRAQIDDEVAILETQQEELAAIESGEDSAIKTLKDKAEEKNE